MSKLTIVAKIVAKADKTEFVKEELMKLVDATRLEDGCINYDLHQDNDNENMFVFYENWQSKAHLDAHEQTTHFKTFREITRDSLAEFKAYEMTHIK